MRPINTLHSFWPGVEFNLTSENIAPSTEWSIHNDRVAVIIHLGGTLQKLEIDLKGRRSALPLPSETVS